MEEKKYISATGHNFTKYVNTDENIAIFNEMCEAELKTIGVPAKDCIHDVIKALKLGRQLRGGDPNTIVIAKNIPIGLAKIQAYSKNTQN